MQVLIKSNGKMQWNPGTVAEHTQDGSNLATVMFDLGFSAAGAFGPAFFDVAPGVAGVGSSYAYKWLDMGTSEDSEASEASPVDAIVETELQRGGLDLHGESVSDPGSAADRSNAAREPGVGPKSASKASSGALQTVRRCS